jgi:hypothetical protein
VTHLRVESAGERLSSHLPAAQANLDHVATPADPPLQRLERSDEAKPLCNDGSEDWSGDRGPPRLRGAPVVGDGGGAGTVATKELRRVAGVASARGVKRGQSDLARRQSQYFASGRLARPPARFQVAG